MKAAFTLIPAESRRLIAKAVVDFVTFDLLGEANPTISASKDTTVREALDKVFVGSQVTVHHFDGDVTVQARLKGFVDRRHPSLAQLAGNVIFSEIFTD